MTMGMPSSGYICGMVDAFSTSMSNVGFAGASDSSNELQQQELTNRLLHELGSHPVSPVPTMTELPCDHGRSARKSEGERGRRGERKAEAGRYKVDGKQFLFGDSRRQKELQDAKRDKQRMPRVLTVVAF
jgi:hypothetical protein